MDGTLNTTPPEPAHTEDGPLMVPAAEGSGLTVTANAGERVPFPQLLVPATVIFPDADPGPKLTVIFLVPAPEAMVAPVGRAHV